MARKTDDYSVDHTQPRGLHCSSELSNRLCHAIDVVPIVANVLLCHEIDLCRIQNRLTASVSLGL